MYILKTCLKIYYIVSFFLLFCLYYRPQTKFEGRKGNVFTGVCDSVNRGGAWSRGSLVPEGGWCLIPGRGLVETPPDGYCCGRYASYWNAFLFYFIVAAVFQLCRTNHDQNSTCRPFRPWSELARCSRHFVVKLSVCFYSWAESVLHTWHP